MSAPTELTKAQALMIEGHARFGDYRTYGDGRYFRGNAVWRMRDRMVAAGLWNERDRYRDSEAGRHEGSPPRRDPILSCGPTAAGLRALLAHGLTADENVIGHKRDGFKPQAQVIAELEERIVALEAAEKHDAEIMARWRKERDARQRAEREKARTARIGLVAAVLDEFGIDHGPWTDDRMLELADRLGAL